MKEFDMNKAYDYRNITDLINNMREEYQEEMKNTGHVNIIIAGKTGVGKSTLINAAFRDDLAKTGMGRPVTDHCQKIEKEGVPIRIYDTVGLELDEARKQQAIDEIRDLIREKIDAGNEDEFIHCMWYCIQSNSDRFEDAEQDFVKMISEECDIPVILVITKSYMKKHAREFAREIENFNLPVKSICCVLAQPYEEEDFVAKASGVTELVEKTIEFLPESAKRAYISAQKASLKLKFEEALDIIKQTAAMAFGAGYAPLPMADAAVLIPIQATMFARITNVYGIKLTQGLITALASSLLGIAGATFVGRAIVANLLKFIPVVGTIGGGTISGATAGILTWGLGRTYIEIMEKLFVGEINADDLEKDDIKDEIEMILKNYLKKDKTELMEGTKD